MRQPVSPATLGYMDESGGSDYPELSPHGWASTFPAFREASLPYVRSSLAAFLPDASDEQIAAWNESIPPLQREVGEVLDANAKAGAYGTILEYQLPLNHRRPDILLLMGGSVLVVEAKGKDRASQADLDQVAAYARDLSAYHELCETRPVHPVLMLTRGSGRIGQQSGVQIIGPDALDGLATELNGSPELTAIDATAFLGYERYRPLPSLVRAARELFETGDLRRIRRAAAATAPAIEVLAQVAHEAAQTRRRFLILVTGSPGTGKTLVGLQYVHAKFLDDLAVLRADGRSASPAVFLSGNGPLVEVLQYELRSAGGGGKAFVRDVKSYVERYLDHGALVPGEHVVVFDEAQRAWDADKVAREHRGSTRGSEPEHLIRFAERIPEWSVVVGLIGTGQEIHDGEEAGLAQWRIALEASAAPDTWTVIAPPEAAAVFLGWPRVRVEPALHLATELRYHAASVVHDFVDDLLTNAANDKLKSEAHLLEGSRYHLRITRDLETAKRYLRDRYADNPDARFGVIASSRDRDLPRFGVANDWNATKTVRKGPWFCDGDEEAFGRSCRSLRDCVTEFGCQGLELDGTLVAWGTDFVLTDGTWSDRHARRYQRPGDIRDAFSLRRNAYRVLLTRGRDTTVVFVPPIPVLDETFEHLLAAGFRELHSDFAVALGADARGPELDAIDPLPELIDAVRSASPLDRIEYRDRIAACGPEALPALKQLATEPGLGPFAIRTIQKIGERGARLQAVETLCSIERDMLGAPVIADLERALATLTARRAASVRAAGEPASPMLGSLDAGHQYRRRALHEAGLGGNRQKGASYPAQGQHVLLFSGGTGHSQYGYDDHWIGDDRLQFFGEWSGSGDMTMTGGNAKIVERSPELYVFFERSAGLQEFQGVFAYEEHRLVPMTRDGRPATAIVFTLRKVTDRVDL
jgi:hypothetical protein